MQVELRECLRQVHRMSGLDYAANLSDDAWTELAKSLQYIAKSQRHAELIVDEYLREGPSKIPAPSEIVKLGRAIECPNPINRSRGCEVCGGTGYRIISSKHMQQNGIGQAVPAELTGAERCVCRGPERPAETVHQEAL